MIRAADLRRRATNKYPEVVERLLRKENPFPLELPYRRIQTTATREVILEEIAVLQGESKEQLGYGLTIIWTEVNTVKYGRNRIPGKVFFATEADFLLYVEKSAEVETIRTAAEILVGAFPELADELPRCWKLLRTGDFLFWQRVCQVLRFFREQPFPERHARELPIPIPTKFIGENRSLLERLLQIVAPHSLREDGETFEDRIGLKTPESLVECRLLDDALLPDWKFRQLTIGVSDLAHLEVVPATTFLITENRTNFLTLPPLPATIALQGQGYAVSRLKRVPFLNERRLLYWGDLDVQGFEILAVLRQIFPQVESALMSADIWHRLSDFRQAGVRSRNQPQRFLPYLHPEEIALFELLQSTDQRLEQEHIPQAEAEAWFRQAIAQE